MSHKEYSEYASNSLKSYDKNIIVEEVLEKLKAQGCFDAKRKQFLSEITNKSTYQNLHTKVENLATKFLETVRWPPSVQKHQLREQLRLHIQSTDQFNNCINRLIEQEVNCKIQGELKPMIESKACEYLEINYERWKQNMLTQIYENFRAESPQDKLAQKELPSTSVKVDIKQEYISTPPKIDIESNDAEVTQSNETVNKNTNLKLEQSLNQSNVVNSSSFNSVVTATSKFAQKSPHISQTNFVSTIPPTMPPPIGLLPPPHRILPNSLFQPLPPPPPPMFLSIERFPPPPPPEDKSLPPPPPPENGPNTPTDEYIPKFYDVQENPVEKIKIGLLKTPDKAIDKNAETKIFSPKKMIWGNIVLSIQDISDDSASDSERNEHERRRYSRKSPQSSRNHSKMKDAPTKVFDESRLADVRQDVRHKVSHQRESGQRDPRRNIDQYNRPLNTSHTHQKSNDYTDVSSESFNEMEFKEVQPIANTQINTKKQTRTSSSEESHSSSSNDHTLDLIRKINKKKTKLRKRQKTPTLMHSSSSYSSSESSSGSSSSDNSIRNQSQNNYRVRDRDRDSERKYRVFGRSQSEEKDMDISMDTQSPSLDPKWDSPMAEINLDSVESVQLRKNQIKARLEEIDAKRSMLQKQQMLIKTEQHSVSNSSSSTSSDSSSENSSSSHSSKCNKGIDKESIIDSKLKSSPKNVNNSNSASLFSQNMKTEVFATNDDEQKVKHDSEPEEGELSSESRAGSIKRENNVNYSDEIQSQTNDELMVKELIKQELDYPQAVDIDFNQESNENN